MNIPVTQLLIKMGDHLQKANQQEEALREHITAIRTLCDLILDQNQTEVQKVTPSFAKQIQVIHPTVKRSGSTEEGVNGDSIFDF